jgi:small subunit ribosomal protein S17
MRRTIQGKVISNKMDKTIVVKIDRKVKHPFYGKYITRSTKFYAHDNSNVANIGDIVLIEESRPISKTKSWLLKTVITRGES